MFLRRFMTRVREASWNAIFAELIIVVLGVFLGIQAANWNDARLQQREGREISERLIVDLRRDLNSRQILVNYYQAVFESAERTVDRLNSDSIDNPSAFVIDLYRSTEYAHRPATRATYEEIISTGKLGLISPEARQAGFVDYYRYDNSLAMRQAVRASPYRHTVRSALPYPIQRAIRERCSDLYNDRFEIVGFDNSCDLGFSSEDLASVADALHSNPELLPELRAHFSILNATMPNFRGEVVNLEATVKALEASR